MIDFDAMINNYLKKDFFPRKEGRYYPSSIGLCLRKNWYSYKFPRETKPDLIKIFEIGNILHDFVVEVLRSEKNPHVELLRSEVPVHASVDDFIISGRVDNLILVKANGKEVLIEVKSAGDIRMIKKPMPHNAMQLQLYMHMTAVHNGILLYIDKKNLKSRVFELDYRQDEALKIVNRFRLLHKMIKENKIPDPEARLIAEENWMCNYCEYKDECYEQTPDEELVFLRGE